MILPPPTSTLFPYTTLFRSGRRAVANHGAAGRRSAEPADGAAPVDRKSTRLNSSHSQISYAVFCLKKKKKSTPIETENPPRDRPTPSSLSPVPSLAPYLNSE